MDEINLLRSKVSNKFYPTFLEVCENIRSSREHEIFSGSGQVLENFEILEKAGILQRIGTPERVGIWERIGNKLK